MKKLMNVLKIYFDQQSENKYLDFFLLKLLKPFRNIQAGLKLGKQINAHFVILSACKRT